MTDIILDTVIDFIKLLPFLFLTYLLMEWIEHNTGENSQNLIKKSGKFGPLIGSLLGVFPQCGFSAAGSTFYAGRIISMGTLIAIYMSTSDEMLPVMIAEAAPVTLIVKILIVKITCAIIGGFIVDLLLFPTRKHDIHVDIDELCTDESCGCKSGTHNILIPAIRHTIKTGLFIFLVKESFEYCGALIDRKTSIARQFKNFNYNLDFVKGNIEKVTKILSVLN